MMILKPSRLLVGLLLVGPILMGQPVDAQPSWQASAATVGTPLALFTNVQMASLPTTQTLSRGDFFYEISHRFHPTLDEGYDANFGLDGPVSMRTALSYGLTDRWMLSIGRSNLLDNLDVITKWRFYERDGNLPLALAVTAGIAFNTDMPAIVDRGAGDADNIQLMAQVVANTQVLDGRLGLGLVPSYVHNSAIFAVDRQHTITLGTYAHFELNPMWGLFVEYAPTLEGYQGILLPGESGRSHDSLSLGATLSTGGHDFYLFATNNTRLNAAQYLVGAPTDAAPDNWHLAFGITRHL